MKKPNESISKRKRGGKRPGSGRKPGTPNKSTKALKELAGAYTEEAVQTLVNVMRGHETPPAVKVQAADKLLDRGHGRPAIHIDESNGLLDKAMIESLKTVFVERLAAARERQRQVYMERGIVIEGE